MVVYVVCYDLSMPMENQIEQVNYWLGYLNSLLSPQFSNLNSSLSSNNHSPRASVRSRAYSTTPYNATPKWSIMLVGTHSDKKHSSGCLNSASLLQANFPSLPICPVIYKVCALKKPSAMKKLYQVLHYIISKRIICKIMY